MSLIKDVKIVNLEKQIKNMENKYKELKEKYKVLEDRYTEATGKENVNWYYYHDTMYVKDDFLSYQLGRIVLSSGIIRSKAFKTEEDARKRACYFGVPDNLVIWSEKVNIDE